MSQETNVAVRSISTSLIVSQKRLKELLDYDLVTGIFRWKIQISNTINVGDIAGTEYDNGYVFICIGGVRYAAHALAWLYVYGELVLVDHKDDVRNHNAIDNLQKATYSQNNHKKYVYNPLGHKGVRFRSGYYEANIRIKGRITRLGQYTTVEEAAEAYKKAAKEHFGKFANG